VVLPNNSSYFKRALFYYVCSLLYIFLKTNPLCSKMKCRSIGKMHVSSTWTSALTARVYYLNWIAHEERLGWNAQARHLNAVSVWTTSERSYIIKFWTEQNRFYSVSERVERSSDGNNFKKNISR